MSLWRMIFTNLRRHRVRTAIGATGIALGVATMLSVVGLLGGAVKMFEKILRSDSEMVVFEKNVSDLFFSNVPVDLVAELEAQPFVKDAQPALFSIIAAPDRPVVGENHAPETHSDFLRSKPSNWSAEFIPREMRVRAE